MTKEENKLLTLLAQAIFDKKGFNILVLDVRGVSVMTDYFIIAEGSVGRHVRALSAIIKETMSLAGMGKLKNEGEKDNDWIVMDYGSIVIHLLTPEMRQRYTLEELWSESKIVDVSIKTTP